MMLKSQLRIEFGDRKTLRAISTSLKPDNVNFPRGMKLSQRIVGNALRVTILFDTESLHQFETLISTLDEIISHAQSALSTIEKTEKL